MRKVNDMKHEWVNFGDCSIGHGQTWISGNSTDDYADIVTVLSGSDIGLGDNQYMIERGSVYLGDQWYNALTCVGHDLVGPPEFLRIAEAVNAYMGFDRDIYGGFEIVQVGKEIDDWVANGTTCDDPDIVLHGNASIERYLERNYLQ